MRNIYLDQLIRLFTLIYLLTFSVINPLNVLASPNTDPNVIGLQTRISNNFSGKYCKAIESGFSKDEAMRSAIIKTENIVAFSLNPKKKMIEKEKLADQIAIKVINKCGWNFGLAGKEGISYFRKYFLEINEKTTPNKKLSG